MNEPKITVIIPVYNVEEYIDRCLESVVNQDYSNLEIIVVDDGSTDNSGFLCDAWGARDNRIKVIHRENGGLADARNTALDMMTGEYVSCVDSDDWIQKDYISYLYTLLVDYDADISMVQLKKVYDDRDQLDKKKEVINKLKKEDAIEKYLYQRKFTASAHCKLYRASVFNDIRYPKGFYYEDMAVICQLIDYATTVVVSNQQKYYYWQRNNSIMNESFSEKKMQRIMIAKEIMLFVEAKYPQLIDASKFRCFLAAIQTFREIRESDDELYRFKEVCWKQIKEYRTNVLLNKRVKMIHRMMAALSFCGRKFFELLGRLYSIIM